MKETYNENFGKLFLRIMIAILLLFHGYNKLVNGTDFIELTLSNNGLPTYLAYAVYIGEIIAPIFLIIGYFTRFFAFVIIINMFVAIYLIHPSDIISFKNNGGLVLELQYFYIFSSLLVVFLGAGKYSIDNK